jgi:hypothetical protein
MAQPLKYSVLLLYPEHASEDYGETYYTYVSASDPSEAIHHAQQNAFRDNSENYDALDFRPVLVIRGWKKDVNPRS